MKIHLLYADSSLVVCEKPVGVSSESPGLPEMVFEQEKFSVLPVHRLDLGTGGACILARNASACAAMQKLFQSDQVVKEYLAVVSGVPDSPAGVYSDLLYHDPRSNKSFVVDKMRKSVREASCEWEMLETADAEDGRDGPLTLVRVRLHSGRTHQIRVQFASRKLPLAGDRRYGSRVRAGVPALWSARIAFPHPFINEKTVEAVSAPPDVFPWNCFSEKWLHL